MNAWTVPQLFLLIILIVGVTARLTRFATKDTITESPRKWITAKAKAETPRWAWKKIDYLLTCPWCVSIYASVPTGVIMIWHGSNRFIIAGAAALTASLITGHVQTREYDPLHAQAQSIEALVRAGFTHASAVEAVTKDDLDLLELP